jgi:hypothetical protein
MASVREAALTDDLLQWLGTVSFLTMYTLMSANQYPWNLAAGLVGGGLYLAWSLRSGNWPQTVTNMASISLCLWGLAKAWG